MYTLDWLDVTMCSSGSLRRISVLLGGVCGGAAAGRASALHQLFGGNDSRNQGESAQEYLQQGKRMQWTTTNAACCMLADFSTLHTSAHL
jgi:hypothetical protein